MKSEREASTKRYQIAFTKLQAGVFAAALFALMGAFFSLGYLVAGRGASSEVAGGGGGIAVSKAGEGEGAGGGAVVALKGAPDKEAASRPADPIEPKFYQELVREEPENGQPIEPIELPAAKKAPPGPSSPPAAVEEASPGKKAAPPAGKKRSAGALAEKPGRRAKARAPRPPAAGSGYAIQVASVRKFDEALRIVRKLRRAGFRAYIRNVDLGARGKWHRVRVGRYRDRAEARKALSVMKGKARFRGARVVRM